MRTRYGKLSKLPTGSGAQEHTERDARILRKFAWLKSHFSRQQRRQHSGVSIKNLLNLSIIVLKTYSKTYNQFWWWGLWSGAGHQCRACWLWILTSCKLSSRDAYIFKFFNFQVKVQSQVKVILLLQYVHPTSGEAAAAAAAAAAEAAATTPATYPFFSTHHSPIETHSLINCSIQDSSIFPSQKYQFQPNFKLSSSPSK